MERVKKLLHRYFIQAMGAMALGLFASLLIGTIFTALGMIPHCEFFTVIGKFAQAMAGPAMAAAIAYSLKADPLVVFSAAAVGNAANSLGGAGGPLAVFFIAIIAVECGMLVSKKTKVDILVTPFVTVLVGGALSMWVAPYIGTLVGYVSEFIGWAAWQAPFVMGIIVSVVVGICLTLPISSAAICAGLVLTGSHAAVGSSEGLAIAGAAAVAGCCAQMVGFATISFRENGWGGVVSQGIGTSMLQMPNILRRPQIWIAPTLASAITGPLAVCVFDLQMYGAAINSGMGTCGLLGPIGMVLGWLDPVNGYHGPAIGALQWVGLALVCFVLPALLSFVFNEILRMLGWVKTGDMKLD
ncbi:MAG: PTS sugar transporter subunit IIC [Ruminococcaceae bacterium]|nr:PTS sugar transporter subunit IIC [Oscillospiraceae bacterium]